VAERLSQILCVPVRLREGEDVHLQVSIGVAVTGGDTGADQILRRADRAMYLAKRRGKGQVVFLDAI
jgi:diguanylate cyclase (GGDEF)-like protein